MRWGAPLAEAPVTEDDDWALSMMHAMLAHRAEQRFSEAAMSAAADDKQIRVCCRMDQDLCGVALPDLCAHLNVAAVTVLSAAFSNSAGSIAATGAGPTGTGRTG